ncbi:MULTISPECIES: hypothetical protein [Brevibacterium]|uniref:hypothetical protein n=1 Tax=Brevibacterium TaxID=1696 RepID=UPI00136F5AEA|nr:MULTISPECIES: hypothetical protein [Brevibacterium]WAL39685.1 hypothetical protein BRM1_10495 [Brevibacterium sp. BRM-1]
MLRALGASAVATGAALALHHAVGGAASLLAALVCLLFTFWAALILLRRRLSLAGLAVTVVGAQLLMHGLMGVFGAVALPELTVSEEPGVEHAGAAPHAQHAPSSALERSYGSHSHTAPASAGPAAGGTGRSAATAGTGAQAPHAAAHAHGPAAHADGASANLRMLLAHALAAAVTVVLLRYGEAALRALPAALLRTVARIAVLVPVRFARPRIRVRPADAPRPLLPALTVPRVLRGPPSACA